MNAGVQKAVKLISEPRGINVAQIILYTIGAVSGAAAVAGAISPAFTSTTVGPWVIILSGCFLTVGGVTGTVAVVTGMWWLECVALVACGIGWFVLLPAAVTYALTTHNSAIWLVVALLSAVLCDAYKRYRRIDWAYLDPTR
jgi:hypothetical protein